MINVICDQSSNQRWMNIGLVLFLYVFFIISVLEKIIAPYKGIPDSFGFWIPRRGFRIPGTGFQSLPVERGFWIPIASGIPDSMSCTPDSKTHGSRFSKQTFPGFLYMGRQISRHDLDRTRLVNNAYFLAFIQQTSRAFITCR